jgi:hypothetical protein
MTKEEFLLNPENPQLQAIAAEIDKLLENMQPGHMRVAALNDFCTIKSLEEDLSACNSQQNDEYEHTNSELIEREEKGDFDLNDIDDFKTLVKIAMPPPPDILTVQRLAIAIERASDRRATIAGYAKEYRAIENVFYDLSEKYDQITGGDLGQEMVAHRMQVALNFFLAPELLDQELE